MALPLVVGAVEVVGVKVVKVLEGLLGTSRSFWILPRSCVILLTQGVPHRPLGLEPLVEPISSDRQDYPVEVQLLELSLQEHPSEIPVVGSSWHRQASLVVLSQQWQVLG